MEASLKKAEIQEKLSKIQTILEKKGIMPVLNHFLMEISNQGSFIIATDLETAVKEPVSLEVLKEGRVCIPGRKFYEIIRELEEDIQISLIEQWLKIKSGKSQFRIVTLDAEEFPVWPKIGDALKIELSRDFLLTAIEKTIYAAGEADARYVLNGLLFHLTPSSEFRVVGTDGHRLALFKSLEQKFSGAEITEDKKVILSKKSLNELRKFLSDSQHDVSFYIGKTHVMFEIDGVSFLTRMIEGNYPDYEAVIPINNDKIAVIDKKSLVNSLKRVSILSRERQNAVKLEFNANSLSISSSDPEFGEAQDELNIEYTAEPIVVGFNARYLIDTLEEISSDKVLIKMKEPEKAVYITDSEDTGSFKYECIVMPMRL